MRKWRLQGKDGKELRIISAVDHAAAEIYGFKHFPVHFHRAVDVKVDEGVRNKLAGVVEHLFLQEGKTPEEAKRAAEIFIQGRYGPPYKQPVDLGAEEAEAGAEERSDLKETVKAKYLNEGRSEEDADRMAEIFVQGRDGRG